MDSLMLDTSIPEPPSQRLAALINIIDNYARTPKDLARVAVEYYRMLSHMVDNDRAPEYPFVKDPRVRHWSCEYTWNQLRSSLLEASPEADGSKYPTFESVMLVSTFQFVGVHDTPSCIRFLQQDYKKAVLEALEGSSRFSAVSPEWLADIPQFSFTPLDDNEKELILSDPVGYLLSLLLSTFQTLSSDLPALTEVMTFFMELIFDVCYCVQKDHYVYNEAKVIEFLQTSVNIRTGFWLCSPFCRINDNARHVLSKLNVEAAFRTLVYYGFALALSHRRSEFLYRMYQFFICSAVKAWPQGKGIMKEYLQTSKERDDVDLYEMVQSVPTDRMEGFYPDKYDRVFEPEQSDEDDEDDEDYDEEIEFEVDDLDDIKLEPVGSPRHASICSNPVFSIDNKDEICTICDEGFGCLDQEQTARRVDCSGQHIFHHDCIESLINGIEPYSNKCPNCREVICPPRSTRPIIDAAPIIDVAFAFAQDW